MWCCGRKGGNGNVVSKNDSQLRRLQAAGLRRDAPPPQVHRDVEAPVLLNVYSLVEGNEKLTKLGMGIFHTGVIVYGIEWSYGEVVDNPNASGLFCVHPGQAAGDLFRTIRVGVTTRSPMQVDTILHRLENEWRSCDYHILHHNCNHFAQRLCTLLSTVEKLRVPTWCNRAARVSDHVIPRKLATKVMRMMDDDPPKAKPPPKKTNVNELPVSIIPPMWYRHAKIAQPPRYCYIVATHEWSNSAMSTPRSSQVSSPTATDHNRQDANGSFVPPPGYTGDAPVVPLSSLEERQPSDRKAATAAAVHGTRDNKKPQRATATTTTSTTQPRPTPAPPLSSTEDGHWPPLAPSRGHSMLSTSIRSNGQPHPPATPLQQASSIFSPASRGSSRAGSVAGVHVDANEVLFSSSRSGMVPVLRRRQSSRRENSVATTPPPTRRPPVAPQSHHSDGSPTQADAELSSSVFDRLSLPESRRATSLMMVMPEIDFTPCPGQATPVGVVLHRSDADPCLRNDDSSVASSDGEDVALVMESELDAALAAEHLASLGSPSVRHDTEDCDARPGHILAKPVYDECAAAALVTPKASPLDTVERMKREHKRQDAHALAAHNPHAQPHVVTPATATEKEGQSTAFTDLSAVAGTPPDTPVEAPWDRRDGGNTAPQRYVASASEAAVPPSPLPPALTAYEVRSPPPSVADLPEAVHALSGTPPPPGATPAPDEAGADAAAHSSVAAGEGAEGLASPPPPPLQPTAMNTPAAAVDELPLSPSSTSAHTERLAACGVSEVLWQGESQPTSVRHHSVTSDCDPALPTRVRAMSVTGTPRRPQLPERLRSESASRAQTPQSQRASHPGTPQRAMMGVSPLKQTPQQLACRQLGVGEPAVPEPAESTGQQNSDADEL